MAPCLHTYGQVRTYGFAPTRETSAKQFTRSEKVAQRPDEYGSLSHPCIWVGLANILTGLGWPSRLMFYTEKGRGRSLEARLPYAV